MSYSDTQTQKKELRKRLLSLRKTLFIPNSADLFLRQFAKLALEKFTSFVSYSPLAFEADVSLINEDLKDKGKSLKIVSQSKDASFPKGDFDVLIIPMLGFDRKGSRLGQGGGWYDRFIRSLAKKDENLLKIGVAFSFQEVENLPIEEKDERVNLIITEKEIIKMS